jgi:glycosyltransferase involved in cell wall biosynthesis
MRILSVQQPGNGVAYHRQWLPLMEMPDVPVLFADFLNDEVLARGWDIVLINRHIPGMELETLLEYRARYGFKLVVDIDDYWNLDPWHILYRTYPTEKIVAHIKAADLVTCTHERLWAEVMKLNRKAEIIPNALPYGRGQFHDGRLPASEDIGPGRLRISYVSSVTHERDLELLRGAWRRISDEQYIRDRTHFVICGFTQEGPPEVVAAWQRMLSVYLAGLRLNGYARAAIEPEQYMAFYAEADVAVAPLVASKFNAMKSNLKVLEAATKGIPIVTSDVHPYLDIPHAIRCANGADWVKAIRKLVREPGYRDDMGAANAEYCRTHFHLDNWNKVRRQIYDKLIA